MLNWHKIHLMAEVIVNKISTNIVENYSEEDLNLIPSFDVISQFNPETDIVEFSIYNEQNVLQYINYNYTDYTVTLDYNTKENAISSVNVNPEKGLVNEGYEQGNYNVIYNFLRNQISSSQTTPYYIKEISSDRTEVRVANNNVSNENLETLVSNFKIELADSPYFEDFEINFGNNNIFLANNILIDSTTEQYTVLIKLYEPLETSFGIKDTLTIVLQTAEEVSYNVNFPQTPIKPPSFLNLKGPNFNLNTNNLINNSTTLSSEEDLFKMVPSNSNPWTGSFAELKGILEDKGITPNVDYSDFNNFIYFSSAEQRVRNFYYKVGEIQEYSSSIAELENISSGQTSGSIALYQTEINNILENLDEYEKYQYYSSGSLDIYPKTNDTPPYDLALTSSGRAINWLTDQATNSGSQYDLENSDNLYNSLPMYVKDDIRNNQFFLFIDMVGQHFDNIWVYTKDVSNRFNADNRLAYGISKDAVADAIRSMGVNLYQNNFTSDNLLSSFTGLNPGGGLLFPTGSDLIKTSISASNDLTVIDDVNKEFYKRIFHNLPLLLKQKGSLSGLRNLINIFGIPDTILRISEFGGKNKNIPYNWDYFQNEFNYAAYNSGSTSDSKITTEWVVNSKWDSADNHPESLMFKFKPEALPNKESGNNEQYNLLLNSSDSFHLTLEYTGSGYLSSSYDGSIPSESKDYAELALWDEGNKVHKIAAPFYNGKWWGVLVTKDGNSAPYSITMVVADSIHNGDDGFEPGFIQSTPIYTNNMVGWKNAVSINIPALNSNAVSLDSNDYYGITGSFQEIRYYNAPLNRNHLLDFVMNGDSIEGINPTSSMDNLIFRAPLGSDLNSNLGTLKSVHPQVSGSIPAALTSSFAANSNYLVGDDIEYVPNTNFYYYTQPVVGIRNKVKEKVKNEALSLPSGDTLSSIRSIQQNYLTYESSSYTKDNSLLEVAFSPQNEINDDINSSLGYFNIGEYIGDPRQVSESVTSYVELDILRNNYFKKYYKNYDWNDYIRLIKFFDNSLFKMIKDFTPAKSSLSTGIVIKQHLLERNKQRPPQVETTQSYYSASIKSGFISGSTGGSFDNINILTSSISPQITQSWEYETQTLSGSLKVTQSTQDEFYNGELSGSEYTVTTSSLFKFYVDPITTSSFDVSRPNFNGNQIVLNPLSNAYFEGSEILGGRIAINLDPGNNKITGIAFGDVAVNSLSQVTFDFTGYYNLLGIGDTITLSIPGSGIYATPALNFTITNKVHHIINAGLGGSNYCFSVEHDWAPVGGWAFLLDNYREYPPYGNINGSAPFPSITQIYDGSPINLREIYPDPLLNLVDINRKSIIYQDVDYSSNTITPVNFEPLTNNSALRAPVQDSNYTKKSWINSRYNGTRVSSLDFNTTIER